MIPCFESVSLKVVLTETLSITASTATTGQLFLFIERNAKLCEGFQQFGIHFIKATYGYLLFRSSIIDDILEIDWRMMDVWPR